MISRFIPCTVIAETAARFIDLQSATGTIRTGKVILSTMFKEDWWSFRLSIPTHTHDAVEGAALRQTCHIGIKL
jgi:hypothetical protein